MLGVTVGLSTVETVLGIVILVLQVALILWKIGYKVYTKIKEKKFHEIENIVKTGIDDLEDVKDKVTKKDK